LGFLLDNKDSVSQRINLAFRREKMKKVSRREFLALTGMSSGALLLAACQPKPTTEPAAVVKEPAAPSADVIPLELITYDMDEVHQKAFQLFVDAHPELKMTMSPVPGSWPDLLAKVNTRIAAGNPPDLTAVATYGPPITWGRSGLLLDLNQISATDPDFTNDPVPLSLRKLFTVDGKNFGMPKDYVTHAVIYNKGLFEQAGIDLPKPDWTWEDMLIMAKALTKGEGVDKIYGWMTSTGPWVAEQYFWGNDGPGFFDRKQWDFSTPTAAHAKNVEALQKLVDSILVDGISPSPEALQAQGAGDRQLSGKLAMWMSHTIDTVNLLKNSDKIDWGVVPNPRMYKGGPSFSMVWTSGFGIIKTTKSVEKSWEFLKHYSIGEGAKVLGTTGFSVPSGVPEAFLTEAMVARGGQHFIDAAVADVAANDSLGEFHNDILSPTIIPNFEGAFLGQIPPEKCLKDIQEAMEDVLAENK
jgi:multiple sugar transport system substrate-binding protein